MRILIQAALFIPRQEVPAHKVEGKLEQRGRVVGRDRSVAKSAFLFVSNAGLLSSFVKAKFGISMPYDR